MKQFHALSFAFGLVSGALLLLLFIGGARVLHPARAVVGSGQFGARGAGSARMAQRLGISQDELQKELSSGKTMQQIMSEHGIDPSTFGNGGGFGRGGSGAVARSSMSGAVMTSSLSAASSVSSH